jgi:hypothetical protein
MATGSILEIKKYFGARYDGTGGTLKEFRAEWEMLSDRDKADLKAGIADETLTY